MRKKSDKGAAVLSGDLALVYVENKPAFFARVEKIDPDIKSGWWRVKLLILNLPLKLATWMLDNEQIRGADFTMGGVPIRLEKIVAPAEAGVQLDLAPQGNNADDQGPAPGRPARILAFKPKKVDLGDDDESS